MQLIKFEDLKAVSYLKTEHLDGRTVNLMPLWDGHHWRSWFPTPEGLVEGKMVDSIEGDYVSNTPAMDSDLFIPFVHLMWQRASWPEICPLIVAICDDFHNMGTSVAKLQHFFNCRKNLPDGAARRFASTELEYLVILARTVFDLLQEMISLIWSTHVKLLDPSAEARRRSSSLPETFSKIVLHNKQNLKSADEIEKQYGLPEPLAKGYASIGPFFSQLRDLRDSIVHGGQGLNVIFDTERGFCVDPKTAPFSSFHGWRFEHYYNQRIASVLPWIADTILGTIDACNSLMGLFESIIQLPPEIAPEYRIFVRGPHNESLARVLQVHSGASPWWD